MESFTVDKLKRNPERIKTLFEVKGNITMVKENIVIVFPERYINRGLANIDTQVSVLSCYAILDDYDNYAITNVPIIQTLTPSNIGDAKINDVNYKVLTFNKDTVFIPNNNMVVRATFLYEIFDEFYIKGKIPWYLDYIDVCSVMLKAKDFADSKIGNNPLSFEVFTSIIARTQSDKQTYYRTIANDKNKNPTYVGLANPYYSFNNTGAKLIGSRLRTGLNTAIVNPEDKSSPTADILRS